MKGWRRRICLWLFERVDHLTLEHRQLRVLPLRAIVTAPAVEDTMRVDCTPGGPSSKVFTDGRSSGKLRAMANKHWPVRRRIVFMSHRQRLRDRLSSIRPRVLVVPRGDTATAFVWR